MAAEKMQPTLTAYDITNTMIRETGEAVRTGDFDLFMKHFGLPFVLETPEGKQLIQSRRMLRRHFKAAHDFRKSHRIVESVRENIMAAFRDQDTISLFHVSHLILECGAVFERYSTQSTIRRVNEKWLTTHCQYSGGGKDGFANTLAAATKTPQTSCGAMQKPDVED